MNEEKYYQIIDNSFGDYLRTYKGNFVMDKEEFINAIKTNPEFSEKWGLKIEERELSVGERLDLAVKTYKVFDPFDFGINAKVDHDEIDRMYPVPKLAISLTYNNETIEVYE